MLLAFGTSLGIFTSAVVFLPFYVATWEPIIFESRHEILTSALVSNTSRADVVPAFAVDSFWQIGRSECLSEPCGHACVALFAGIPQEYVTWSMFITWTCNFVESTSCISCLLQTTLGPWDRCGPSEGDPTCFELAHACAESAKFLFHP